MVKTFMQSFESSLGNTDLMHFDKLPAFIMELDDQDNDMVVFEWIFSAKMRLGFTLCSDVDHSAWMIYALDRESPIGRAFSLSGAFERNFVWTINDILKVLNASAPKPKENSFSIPKHFSQKQVLANYFFFSGKNKIAFEKVRQLFEFIESRLCSLRIKKKYDFNPEFDYEAVQNLKRTNEGEFWINEEDKEIFCINPDVLDGSRVEDKLPGIITSIVAKFAKTKCRT